MNVQTSQSTTSPLPSGSLTEDQWQALLEQAHELVLIAGPGDGFLYANARGPALLDFSQEELLHLKIHELVPEEDAQNFLAELARLPAGEKFRRECRLKRKAGQALAVELSVQALPGGLRLLAARDIRERLRAEHLQAGETRVLERIARGHALPDVLETLALAIEAESEGMLCSILLLDEEGKHLLQGAAPSLPQSYNRAVHGVAISPDVGSCGTAAFTGEVVITPDITRDPRWAKGQELAASHRLRACWSTPIKSSKGKVLGTFALYYHEVREPGAKEKELISKACYLAGIAIERQQEVAALRQSEARLARAQKVAHIGCWEWNLEKNLIWWSEELYRVFGMECRAAAPSIEEFLELVVPEDRASLRSQIDAVMTQGAGPSSAEYRIRLPDGSKLDMFGEAEMDRDSRGQPKRLIGTVQDNTERKRAAESVRQSRQQYLELVNSIDGIVWEADAKTFKFRFVSQQAARLLGYPVQQWFEPEFWQNHIHPDDRSWAVSYCVELTRSKKDHEFEYRMLAADGRIVWLRDIVTLILEEGEPVLLRGIMVDVTRQRQAEADRNNAFQLLQSVIDSVPAYIAYVDAEQRYRLVNRRYEEWFQRPRSEILGQHLSALHPESVYAEMQPQVAIALRGEPAHFERSAPDAGGKTRWFTINYVPHFGEDGAVLGFFVLVSDITERKLAENEISALNTNLEKRVAERTSQIESANKELEAFCYSISHDLRAPLRHIAGFANLLQDHAAMQSAPDAGKLLASILEAARNMDQLTHDLLLFSRMGRESMAVRAVALEPLFREAINSLQGDVGNRDVAWKIPVLPTVQGDRAMLRQVLNNLLGNALKYTRHCPQAVIEIRCTETEVETIVVIQDNGVGFNSAYADKLFGVFQRLHTAEEFEGTGIGLANVRRIITRHGGRTWAEGAINAGAKFYFSLPRLKETHQPPVPLSHSLNR